MSMAVVAVSVSLMVMSFVSMIVNLVTVAMSLMAMSFVLVFVVLLWFVVQMSVVFVLVVFRVEMAMAMAVSVAVSAVIVAMAVFTCDQNPSKAKGAYQKVQRNSSCPYHVSYRQDRTISSLFLAIYHVYTQHNSSFK
jgi:ABC-type multidrug transport system fused ATPase/permease subunit